MWYFNTHTHTHTHTHPSMTLLFQARGDMREQEKSIRRCRFQLSSAQPAGHPWAGQCTSLGIFVLPYVSGRLPWAPQTSPGSRQTHAEDQERNPWAPHKHCSNFPSFSEEPYFTFSSQNPWKEGRPGLGGILPAQTAGTSALAGFPEHRRLGIPRGTFRRLSVPVGGRPFHW